MAVEKDTWAKLALVGGGIAVLAIVGVLSKFAEEERRSEERAQAQQAMYAQREDAKKAAAECMARRASREAKQTLVIAYWGPHDKKGTYELVGLPSTATRPLDLVLKAGQALSALAAACQVPSEMNQDENLVLLMAASDPEMKQLEVEARVLRARQKTEEDEAKAAAAAARLQQASWALKEQAAPLQTPQERSDASDTAQGR